jgi:hypothetical protein
MNPKNTSQKQQQRQKRHEGKSKCKDKNLDNTSRLIEAPASFVFSYLKSWQKTKP